VSLTGCLSLLGALGFTVLLFSPAREAMEAQLDSSNYGSYSHFAARDFQYGTEVVPMAGPYGFVPYGSTYSGEIFWPRLRWELLTKLVLGGLVVWFFIRAADHPVLRLLWLLLVALLAPLINDVPYSLAILLAGLGLAEHHLAAGRRNLAVGCGLAAYLALLTLFKGTQAMLAMATLGLLFLQALRARNFRRLPWILAAYGLTLAILLLVAGQNPLNFPRYLRGVMELSSGYNAAMGLEEPGPVFLAGLVSLLAIEAMILLRLVPGWRDPVTLAGGLLLAGFSFAAWKHGFVRSDGHVYLYFHYAGIVVPTVLLFFHRAAPGPPPGWVRATSTGLALLALALVLLRVGDDPWARLHYHARGLPGRLLDSWQQLTSPARAKAELDRMIARQRENYQLAGLRPIVGDARIDFFGHDHGYLMLNRLNYRPRPMGGGTFNVFTPWLQDINVACLLDPARRPEYFLVNLQTIDDRFAAQDDAATLRALLANYRPVETSDGLTLFRANPDSPRLPAPELLGTQPLQWDRPVRVPGVRPDQLLLVSLALPANLAGRLRAALYKPPLVFMDLQGPGIAQPHHRRIIPLMFHRPVPLNPVLESTHDLLALYQDGTGKVASEITFRTAQPDSFDSAGMTVTFHTVPRPEPTTPAPLRLHNPLVSKIEPFLVEAEVAPLLREDGMVAQILVPPARLGFELQGDETHVRFAFGMAAATYVQSTDGIGISAELERPGQAAVEIFQAQINPQERPADRGKHPVRLLLPPLPAGSRLYLRIDRGPANDGAWDLGYFTDIDFDRGPFVPAQFPGFATLPRAVIAGVCGAFTTEGREVFMLNAPGSLVFQLAGPERKLRFSGGILAGAYNHGAKTDGVDFQVDVQLADGSLRRLFQYHLDPRENAADRTDRSFEVSIPESPVGSSLILRVTPGPSGSAAWDWSYLSSLRLQ
jgi:hypothetical protein